jgi:hypothetical protein
VHQQHGSDHIRKFGPEDECFLFSRRRKRDPHLRTRTINAVDGELSLGLLDNTAHDTQAKATGAVAALRCEERLKHALPDGRWNARARVGHFHIAPAILIDAGADRDVATLYKRIARIEQDVQQRELDLGSHRRWHQ